MFTTAQYSDALHTVTKFYGAQRSGSFEYNWLLAQYPAQQSGTTAGQGACFPRDGKAYDSAADFSGGWHDAGDNIKFTNTIAWAAYVLLKSYDAFPAAHADKHGPKYGPADGVPDVLNEVKWVGGSLELLVLCPLCPGRPWCSRLRQEREQACLRCPPHPHHTPVPASRMHLHLRLHDAQRCPTCSGNLWLPAVARHPSGSGS